MKKKVLSCFLATVMAAGMLTGCGGSDVSSESSEENIGAQIEVDANALTDISVEGD